MIKPTKPDISIMNFQYKVGNILGCAPLQKNRFQKIYSALLFGCFLSLTVFTFFDRSDLYHESGFSLADVLDAVECLSELGFVALCLIGNSFKYAKNWKRFFESVARTERKFNEENFKVQKSLLLYRFEILFYHLIYILVHVYENYVWIKGNEIKLVYGYISFRIAMYFQFFSLLFICNCSQILRRRYEYLTWLILDIVKGKSVTLGVAHGNIALIKLKNIQAMHKMLYNIVKELNVIFGWQIFFILECTVLSMLNSADFALRANLMDLDYNLERVIIYILVYPCIYIISTAALVTSCDGMEKSGKTVTTACYIGLDGMGNSLVREELILMAHFTETLTPAFSAAGFFQVNRQLLSTLFSSITTYLIIIIQFHRSL